MWDRLQKTVWPALFHAGPRKVLLPRVCWQKWETKPGFRSKGRLYSLTKGWTGGSSLARAQAFPDAGCGRGCFRGQKGKGWCSPGNDRAVLFTAPNHGIWHRPLHSVHWRHLGSRCRVQPRCTQPADANAAILSGDGIASLWQQELQREEPGGKASTQHPRSKWSWTETEGKTR